MYGSMTKTEDLDPRSHGKFESVSTLGTAHGYVDDRLPFPRGREGSHCGTVERQGCPMVSSTIKGKTITTKGVDGSILKHWTTSRVRTVFSNRDRIHRWTTTDDSKFSGR